MKQGVILLLLFALSSFNNFASAQFGEDTFTEVLNQLKYQMETYFGDQDDSVAQKELQLKFMTSFLKLFVGSELRLDAFAQRKNSEISAENQIKIRDEVNDLVKILFDNKFQTLQELINDLKKNPESTLTGLFSESSFSKDIQSEANQELLSAAIVDKILNKQNLDQNLSIATNLLDGLKGFIVKHKEIPEATVDKAFSYLKDKSKIRKSIQKLLDKLSDKQLRVKFISLAYQMQFSKSKHADLMKILQNDKELSKLIDDDDWESLIAIKDSITQYGGKAMKDYYSKNRHQDENEEDEEEEEREEEQNSQSSPSKLLIFFLIIVLLGGVYLGVRRYRKNKFEDGSVQENKKIYQQSL